MKTLRELLDGWTWRMAWRDSRAERRRLLVFSLSILFGVAALVAIGSLNRNLGDAVETQAKDLLGADLMLNSRRPFQEAHAPERWGEPDGTEEAEARKLIDGLPGDRQLEVSFTTMLLVPKSDDARLVNVRGIDRGYPFFGEVETAPADAWERCQKGDGVVLEGSIAGQYEIQVGDIVKLGQKEYPVLGLLVKSPPQASAFGAFAPQVFMLRSEVGDTGLLGERSIAVYRVYFRIDALVPGAEVLNEEQKKIFKTAGIRAETVADRKRNLGKTLDRLYSFFSLIGFVALLLGGVGIASAIHVHVSGRLKTVATLRCLGCTPAKATAVFLAQGIALGLIGSLAGAMLGVALQQFIPRFFKDQLPFEIALDLAPSEVLTGVGIGFLICITFTMLPLLKVRRVSPLSALRGHAGVTSSFWRDPYSWLALGAVVAALTLLAVALSPANIKWLGIGFMLALGVIVAVLALVAKVITILARKLVGARQPYVLRQGMANLYRPRNQTTLFLLSAGLGVCLVLTLFLTQKMLVEQLGGKTLAGKADTYLIDVQSDQREGVGEVFAELGLEVMEEAPMISMRLRGLKGRKLAEVQQDKQARVPGWVLRRDFRSTYRATQTETEKLLRGDWVATWSGDISTDAAPVSLEEGIARDLKLDVGDELEMSVGGILLKLKVANIRRVEWGELGLNFFMVFPMGVLEEAPAFNVVTTRTPSDQITGALNREIVKRFPNVTVFDASLVFDLLREIVGRVGWVIQFMAMFTVFTGVLILIGTILSGKRDRVEESVLLRTLGASRAQIWRILVIEYALLGLFAALAGALLAMAASWALATFVFELDFLAYFWPIPVTVFGLTGFTVTVGLLLSRGITRHPPLAILRAEGR
ncbi:MAG: putative ABC transport system permease protein [Pseudoalteromonas tetraodonis]|jgi:putative ABC transport system permease protein